MDIQTKSETRFLQHCNFYIFFRQQASLLVYAIFPILSLIYAKNIVS